MDGGGRERESERDRQTDRERERLLSSLAGGASAQWSATTQARAM
jgi:hypothetical protein